MLSAVERGRQAVVCSSREKTTARRVGRARFLGLSNHALLRRLTIKPAANTINFTLEGIEPDISAPENDDSTLIVAELYKPGDNRLAPGKTGSKTMFTATLVDKVPRFSSVKIHDVYALGVVLLEIGIWQTAMRVYQEVSAKQRGNWPNAKGIRKMCLDVANKMLSYSMGPACCQALVYCLSLGSAPRSSPNSSELALVPHSSEVDTFAMEFRRNVVQRLDINHLLA